MAEGDGGRLSRCGVMRSIFLILVSLLAACGDRPEADVATIVLTGGTVYSGENAPPVVADVWLRGNRIVAVGSATDLEADMTFDVSGLAVAPGFIDLHSHVVRSSRERSGLYRWPDAENVIRQGITTVIGGPDGWSPVPLEDSFREFAKQGAAVNYGAFVGHGAVRDRRLNAFGFENHVEVGP